MNRGVLTLVVLLSGWSAPAIAQTNSWISPSSGNWQDPYWSIGMLPGTNQYIFLTNDGSKTLRIGRETAESYSETLRVGPITISAQGNFINTLLLDSVGLERPLLASNAEIS